MANQERFEMTNAQIAMTKKGGDIFGIMSAACFIALIFQDGGMAAVTWGTIFASFSLRLTYIASLAEGALKEI